jgi:transposase
MKKSNNSNNKLPLEISDAMWNRIYPILADFSNIYIGDPQNCRLFLSAVLWITKEGASWRALPKAYGYWNTIYRRFSRWCDAGVFETIQDTFHTDTEISTAFIDSTSVKAHACAAGAPKKRGSRSTSTRA